MGINANISIRFKAKQLELYNELVKYINSEEDITINGFIVAAIKEKLHRIKNRDYYKKTEIQEEDEDFIQKCVDNKKYQNKHYFIVAAIKKLIEDEKQKGL